MSRKTKLNTIKADSTLYVFDDGSREQVVKKVKAALRKGATVTWEDGSVQWITVNHRIDASKRGSEVYTWDKSGEKVKADLVLMTKTLAGTKGKPIGTKFVNP